jgi:hypothetical protein
MASTTSPPPDEPAIIDMEEFGRELIARRAAAGNPTVPRNSGTRRTPSKRALLAAIEKAGGRW